MTRLLVSLLCIAVLGGGCRSEEDGPTPLPQGNDSTPGRGDTYLAAFRRPPSARDELPGRARNAGFGLDESHPDPVRFLGTRHGISVYVAKGAGGDGTRDSLCIVTDEHTNAGAIGFGCTGERWFRRGWWLAALVNGTHGRAGKYQAVALVVPDDVVAVEIDRHLARPAEVSDNLSVIILNGPTKGRLIRRDGSTLPLELDLEFPGLKCPKSGAGACVSERRERAA